MKLLLHSAAEAQIRAILRQPRGTVLLHGARGVGKMTAALEVARQLNCEGCKDEGCRSCKMAAGGNHPNIALLSPDEKGKIGIETVQQMQRSLQFQQYEKSGHRVVVIADADTLTLPAQNALLKTLEEPPVGSLIILTAQAPQALLPTVLSRARSIFVPTVADPDIERFVRGVNQAADFAAVVKQSHGLAGRAVVLATEHEKLQEAQELAKAAGQLLEEEDLLPRLQLAVKAASDAARRIAFVNELWLQVRENARRSDSRKAVLAVERMQERLLANVNPKTVFEAFAVELR